MAVGVCAKPSVRALECLLDYVVSRARADGAMPGKDTAYGSGTDLGLP